MTLKVLVHVSRMCTRQNIEPPETLVGAIVMQGIGPFFRAFTGTPDVLTWLRPQPEALSGLLKVIPEPVAPRISHCDLPCIARDEDVAVVQEAALLHDFAEMLLWCHAPCWRLKWPAGKRPTSTSVRLTFKMKYWH